MRRGQKIESFVICLWYLHVNDALNQKNDYRLFMDQDLLWYNKIRVVHGVRVVLSVENDEKNLTSLFTDLHFLFSFYFSHLSPHLTFFIKFTWHSMKPLMKCMWWVYTHVSPYLPMISLEPLPLFADN